MRFTQDDPCILKLQTTSSTDPDDKWLSDTLSANYIYKGDNFLVRLEIKAFKTSIMSVHSLPNLY